jgi:HemY protein
MRRLLWLLALFALAVGVSLLVRFNDGYMVVVFPPYRAELSLNLAMILVVVGFTLLYGLLRGFARTRAFPARVRAFHERRRLDRAAGDFQDALRLLFEGRFSHALKKAEAAHTAGHSPGLSALVAANAAQRLREPGKQEAWLDTACLVDPKMQAARLMLEAQMHIDTQRFGDAVSALQRLQQLAGRHIAALRLELRAQQGCGNWNEVLRISRQLEKRGRLQVELTQEIKLKAHRENLRQRQSTADSVLSYLREIPTKEHNPRLVRSIAEALIAVDAEVQAQSLIETQLDNEWDSALVHLYGSLKGGDPTSRIARADKWLLAHGDDPQLLLTLGRLCLAQRLWGKAQTYLEAALSLEDRREVRLELARLFEQTERPEVAMRHYRAAAEAVS